MTLDGFLTFLALIIAAYAIVPSVSRLRLRLRLAWPVVISLVGFAAVIYFEFFSLLNPLCPYLFGRACRFLNITPESPITTAQAAFIVVILWLILVWIALARTTLSAHALPTLSRLVSQLVYEHRYAELVELIEPHVGLLDDAAKQHLKFVRFHNWLNGLGGGISLIERIDKGEFVFTERPLAYRMLNLASSKLARLVPSGRRAEEAAIEIFRVLLQTPGLTTFAAMSRPAFGIKLLSCSVYGVHDFCDAYLRILIANSQSSLYTEIQQNQNISTKTGYYFPEYNRLLCFLFKDARNAEKLGVWKPLGEYLIAILRPDAEPDYVDFLNAPADSFEDEKWRDRAFVIIRFFDLMVNAAEHQGIQWHMWLYYFPYFVERIIAIYDASGDEIDLTAEWPTRASYLLYVIFSALTSWIETVQLLPSCSPYLSPESDSLTHENGNIPKSATLALGSCLEKLLTADCITERFKAYIHDIVIRTVEQMSTGSGIGRHRALLIKSIIHGGFQFNQPPGSYGETLKRLWQNTDHVVKARIKGYEGKLFQVYP